MKHLRQYIRQILLAEGMKTAADLQPQFGVLVDERPMFKEVKICYCLLRSDGSIKSKLAVPQSAERYKVNVWGSITINQNHTARNNTYQVAGSRAESGYGPLLYDIGIEIATQKGDGLVSDREEVSDAAKDVWDYYLQHRVGKDVEAHQMDDLDNTLTPTPADNAEQISAKIRADDWWNVALSKRYTKKPTRMAELGKRLVMA